ncbi:MAG: SDR family oxidoreductase [Thermoleophilia bacterium]|nr:SDR family oxidoreductase [Thermoleophilia bacterium]
MTLPPDMFSIAGRRAVITGGTAGIGLGVARHFVRASASVVITGRRATGGGIAASIGASFVPMDVRDDASVCDGMAAAARLLGGIDILVLNAGLDEQTGTVAALDLDAVRRVLDVNLGGVVRGLRYGTQHMGPGGSIVVTSSPAGRLTAPGLTAYSASKAAVDSVVRTAALELGVKGIRVNAVLPGIIASEMEGGATGDAAWIAELTVSGAVRPPEDVAGVFHFLASDAACAVTGAAVPADDGITAGLGARLLERAFGPARPARPSVR